jgi:hypothetical protein
MGECEVERLHCPIIGVPEFRVLLRGPSNLEEYQVTLGVLLSR